MSEVVGVIGLGNMGSALAANLAERGRALVVHDAAGADRAPAGATVATSCAEVARAADVVVLSLPDGAASELVAGELASTADRRASTVVDTSTTGVEAARRIDGALAGAGIGYVDAPVSGGPAGARARTLVVMYAGTDAACARVEPVLDDVTDRRRRVGDRAGLGQAMKLANNFLSATALLATSEAVAFGAAAGLDPATMLEVLSESSGRSSATDDKFPAHVLTGRYASGFANTLMAKDLALYREATAAVGGAGAVGALTAEAWQRFAEEEPGVDFTRIHPWWSASPT